MIISRIILFVMWGIILYLTLDLLKSVVEFFLFKKPNIFGGKRTCRVCGKNQISTIDKWTGRYNKWYYTDVHTHDCICWLFSDNDKK